MHEQSVSPAAPRTLESDVPALPCTPEHPQRSPSPSAGKKKKKIPYTSTSGAGRKSASRIWRTTRKGNAYRKLPAQNPHSHPVPHSHPAHTTKKNNDIETNSLTLIQLSGELQNHERIEVACARKLLTTLILGVVEKYYAGTGTGDEARNQPLVVYSATGDAKRRETREQLFSSEGYRPRNQSTLLSLNQVSPRLGFGWASPTASRYLSEEPGIDELNLMK
ncbi:hypothetical protein C8F04DRAFT_1180757 [Mycena alexandri]|uniref:Uncharacterized protein n=1 Tax=Mycena alexandri TaxID=1745969 RepID=A0AAD6T4B5_9AGAR|nr:hypothetical protein C8F04DRAFT_1180757 [Mycena alexandri]